MSIMTGKLQWKQTELQEKELEFIMTFKSIKWKLQSACFFAFPHGYHFEKFETIHKVKKAHWGQIHRIGIRTLTLDAEKALSEEMCCRQPVWKKYKVLILWAHSKHRFLIPAGSVQDCVTLVKS